MKDEEYIFHTDVAQKKSVARSGKYRRTHNGSRGAVKFPSDYLSKKELRNMNRDVKAYKLNEPMTWKEFKKMPDDLKRSYLDAITQRFNAPKTELTKMFGVNYKTLTIEMNRLGCGKSYRGKLKWDETAFEKWRNGATEVETPVEEINVPVEAPVEENDVPVAVSDEEPAEESCCVNTQLQTAGELNYRLEYFRKCEELETAKMELEIARSEFNALHDLLIEAKAIKRTLYVVFGRQFDDECYVACGGGLKI